MRYFKKMVGEQIYLSPINTDDVEIYTKWMNDPGVSVNFGMGHRLFSLFQERRELEELSGRFVFAIVDIATDKLLGNVFFMDVDSIYRIAEAGIFIGDGDARGKGIGTQALKLLLSYGFDTLNLHSINLHVHADNLAAIRCYEKAGFKEYGRRTESVFKNGAYVDMVSMQILDRDFRNH